MALDDIKVTRPSTRPERIPRVADYAKYENNLTRIFRWTKRGKRDTKAETGNERSS